MGVEFGGKAFFLGVRIIELSRVQRAIGAAKTRSDATRINHRRKSIRRRHGGTRRTNFFTRRVSTMGAHHGGVSAHFEPVHVTPLSRCFRADAGNVVFHHAGEGAFSAAVAQVQVYRHAKAQRRVRKFWMLSGQGDFHQFLGDGRFSPRLVQFFFPKGQIRFRRHGAPSIRRQRFLSAASKEGEQRERSRYEFQKRSARQFHRWHLAQSVAAAGNPRFPK